MACPIVGYKGECLDFLIRQGATFGPIEFALLNPDNTPVDITDLNFRGQIRKTFDAATVAATMSFVKTDPANGKVQMTIDAIQTANIPAGNTEDDPLSQYVHDIEYVNETGIVTAFVYGDAKVFREVTK